MFVFLRAMHTFLSGIVDGFVGQRKRSSSSCKIVQRCVKSRDTSRDKRTEEI